ncbi:fumarylacetoacetase [Mycolicibacterium insubricum]|uniref:Fumarylacetoacetase n=1 Tax=Mycolicibacterium insubricum TaxID=444597 RepID=A0A1X0DFZ4_9MYCO|nr:fumarylacetoacetate hydrolase family protein [Mycolicibacterium insubricum]MCV7080176.1 fumarylacetoacetate hydrolase family protein [Mycolicibacterium insubricum]ORA71324.1 fumarylacetoacetase [Mycolicibacterium insubricum]BBZ68069.1 fumarylacetoacetase [Mycolicibacterium insubricum]
MSRNTIRRLLNRAGGGIEAQADTGEGWRASEQLAWQSPFRQDFELARYAGMPDGAAVLPVCPGSFRDFMLFEKHVIDASRGMARRFMPQVYEEAVAFERENGESFPQFRPNSLWYRQPIYYMSNALTIIPSGAPVHAPAYTTALDFELELGAVLARPLLNASPEEAAAAIGALVVINDFSARDVQLAEMQSGFGPQRSKHFVSSMSSTAVTGPDLEADLDRRTASVTIDGELVAETGTEGMRYSLGEAIAHCSQGEQLFPGELFSTGTLPGGSGMELGRWLAPGQTLRLEIDGIGVVEHLIGGEE